MKVLSVASECVPLVKTGGLADVAGALPDALAPIGVDMRTLVPGYPGVLAALSKRPRKVLEERNLFGGKARVLAGKLGSRGLYVLDAPHLFDREGEIYLGPDGNDWPDNPSRFAALSWIAAKIATSGDGRWVPQLLHLHDWQAAFAPLYLRQRKGGSDIATLLTIHNIAFQGHSSAGSLAALKIPKKFFTPDGVEFYGKISALKAGLVMADKISTVSPTYAEELMRPEFGMGLDGVLRHRAHDLVGILNGIDTEVWNPPFKSPRGKARYKAALRRKLGLPEADGPLAVVVSRLTEQKGLDLLLNALPLLLAEGGQLALLGSGDRKLEAAFRNAADTLENVAVRIGYDEALARDLIAGGDTILVPSRFEPCGLTQLYGLRFGTLPFVSLTGGLADTVIPASTAGRLAGVATGFQFHPVDQAALERALRDMCAAFRNREEWTNMVANAMRHPVGWETSAREYAALYQDMIAAK